MRVGIDVQGEEAVARAWADFGAAYLDRVYTQVEQTSSYAGEPTFLRGLTALYASKEAVLKVLESPGGVPLTDVEILLPDAGPAKVRLGGVAHRLARDLGIGPVSLSVSHDGPVAIAIAIAADVG